MNRPRPTLQLLLVLLAVAAFAGAIRFTSLSRPAELVFDEVYYAKDACLYSGGSRDTCRIDSDAERYWVDERDEVGSWVHPPIGKWLISLGIETFGMNAFGWRVAAALAGTLTVVLTAGLAWLLFRSLLWTAAAGVLLATESMHVVQSRLALLDIFLCLFTTLGFTLLVMDRQQKRAKPERLLRPWLLLSGLAFGAATATKWSGAMAMFGAFLLTIGWEVARLRHLDQDRQRRSDLPALLLHLGAAFLVLPAIAYVISYWRFWSLHGIGEAGRAAWVEMHQAASKFHLTLSRFKMEDGAYVLDDNGNRELTHPYSSPPWTWPVMLRPVSMAFTSPGTQIVSVGNPVIFWSSLFTIPASVVAWWFRRDWRAGFIVVAALSMYLPWFATPDRVQFLFYMTPIVPFLVLALTYWLWRLGEYRPEGSTRRPYEVLAASIILLSVMVFAYFYPVLTDVPLSETWWRLHMWLPTWV